MRNNVCYKNTISSKSIKKIKEVKAIKRYLMRNDLHYGFEINKYYIAA